MSRYLLDTTALIDFSKGREPARSRILAMIQSGDDVGVCAVNVAEFCAGLPPSRRAAWDKFFGSLLYWDITREAAEQAGSLLYESARLGRPLSTTDVLIASVALEVGAVLVTDDARSYPMPGLQLVSLRAGG